MEYRNDPTELDNVSSAGPVVSCQFRQKSSAYSVRLPLSNILFYLDSVSIFYRAAWYVDTV